ncbi:MAG TPA: hypothetical protein VN736_01265 [Candidatus Limnocylindrales bacterium]|nr:hypothetical protein [Candidatus Limnocylindrales bacterium]
MDNRNLREDQRKVINEALMMAAAAHRFAELGQSANAKDSIETVIEHLTLLASGPHA